VLAPRAKKSYGQHFLKNENIAARIAGFAGDISDQVLVLEVGPGKGILTQFLKEKHPHFYCVELDPEMIEYLSDRWPDLMPRIIRSDFLRVDITTLALGKEVLLIGNFPYNISSQIVFHAIQHRQSVLRVIGMFQKEMADRIIAPPGGKSYGVISVLTQAYFTGRKLMDLAPGSFDPPPKVNSTVIELSAREDGGIDVEYKAFARVVKCAFSMRRKMLRNNLKSIFDKELMTDTFFDRRPEQLSVSEFVSLTKYLNDPINYKM
jgi:16S rRNA (adenine1518-N6/adenine1519-N6)-dimethyltransferase